MSAPRTDGRTVLVTGATGFVGRRLAMALCEAGDRVVGVTSGPDPSCAPVELRQVELHRIDIRDIAAIERLLDETRPSVVVHLAGLSHVGESWKRPGAYFEVNFAGARNVFRAAASADSSPRILFASSCEVYGRVPEDEQPIVEDRPLDPRSPYAMTKACAEEVARDYGATVVRSFNSIGPGQARRFAMPSFAAQLRRIAGGETEPTLRVGDLSPRRDFLHVDDAVDGYRVLIERGERGEAYNLAGGEVVSIRQALERLMSITGVEADIMTDESRLRPRSGDIPLLCGDAGRLRALGWSPSRSFDQALADLWRSLETPTPVEDRA